MNLKRIKNIILVNLLDVAKVIGWFFISILGFIAATTCTVIACLVSYKIVLFLFDFFGFTI